MSPGLTLELVIWDLSNLQQTSFTAGVLSFHMSCTVMTDAINVWPRLH